MLANQGSARKKRQIQNNAKFWPDNIVYYYYDSSLGKLQSSRNEQLVARHKYATNCEECDGFLGDEDLYNIQREQNSN